jgi:hypothetical protein
VQEMIVPGDQGDGGVVGGYAGRGVFQQAGQLGVSELSRSIEEETQTDSRNQARERMWREAGKKSREQIEFGMVTSRTGRAGSGSRSGRREVAPGVVWKRDAAREIVEHGTRPPEPGPGPERPWVPPLEIPLSTLTEPSALS